MTEAEVQQGVRLEAARLGWYLWRNNSGAFFDEHERMVRYGLANESKALNKKLKSSDLIGLDDCGIFAASECKSSDWVFNPKDEREVAQLAFITLVRRNGGRAGFVTDPTRLARQCCRSVDLTAATTIGNQ